MAIDNTQEGPLDAAETSNATNYWVHDNVYGWVVIARNNGELPTSEALTKPQLLSEIPLSETPSMKSQGREAMQTQCLCTGAMVTYIIIHSSMRIKPQS